MQFLCISKVVRGDFCVDLIMLKRQGKRYSTFFDVIEAEKLESFSLEDLPRFNDFGIKDKVVEQMKFTQADLKKSPSNLSNKK